MKSLTQIKNKIIILFLSLLLFLLTIGIAYADNCADVIANVTSGIPGSTVTMSCNGNMAAMVNCNATSSSTACINIGASNIVLEGFKINGNGTGRGIQDAGKSNVTVKNSTVSTYEIGVRSSVAYNVTFDNLNIFNVSSRGISIENTNLSFVLSSYIQNATTTGSGTSGILFSGDSNNNLVNNTKVEHFYDLINFADNNPHINNKILNTNLTHSYEYCLYFRIGTNYTQVNNIRAIDCGFGANGNAIDLWGYYNNISNSYISNHSHQGIDLLTDDATIGGLNQIFNNVINSSTSDDNHCIFIRNSNNNSIYNNTCYGDISSVGNDTYQYGNTFYLNKIFNSNYSIVAKTDSYWYNNSIYNPYISSIYIQTDNTLYTRLRFQNNIFDSGIAAYKIETINPNVTINESSSIYHLLNFTNGATIKATWNGNKYFNVVNNTITISSSVGNISAFWTHNNSLAFNNLATSTLTMPSNGGLNVVISSASGGCDYPYQSWSMTKSEVFCNGNYLINSSGGGVGALQAGASNIDINCNFAQINGYNNDWLFVVSAKNNVTFRNCYIANYTNGIKILNSNNTLITNVGIYNFSLQGIVLQSSNITTIDNTKINPLRFISGVSYGIRLINYGTNLTIQNNNLNYSYPSTTSFYYPIRVEDNQTSVSILNNTVMNGYINIQTYANGTIIKDNKVFNASWNGIQFYSYYNIIDSNLVQDFGHHGIDTHNDYNYTISGSTNITNNSVFSNLDMNSGETSIFVQASINNLIRNNNVQNLYSNGVGIAVEGGNQSYGNNISNNYISSLKYCMYDSSLNDVWQSNSLSNCALGNQVFGNYPNNYQTYNKASFINNIYLNGFAIYNTFSVGMTNYTISEYSLMHNISLMNGAKLYFTTPTLTRKVITVTNNSISAICPEGYICDWFYSNQSTPIYSNINAVNMTVANNSRVFVFGYLTSTEPRYTIVDKDIIKLTSISLSSKTAEFNCSGSGAISIENLLSLGDNYYVYHNGILLGTSSSDTYTTDGTCSNWLFTTSQKLEYENNIEQPMINALQGFVSLIQILIVGIIFVPILFIVLMKKNMINFSQMITYSIIGVLVIFIILFFILIFIIQSKNIIP